nr:zinc finger, CCHC-type [Tanacetum cinerariifolium]
CVFKKQTCITGSTMEYEFVALAAADKDAEWLKNLLLEIPLWSKPIAPIFIRCDSAAILTKAYTQMYNGKSRLLGVRHSMIHKLIKNEVISIESVRSQQNLADHLTKGLARDLGIKSAEGIDGIKSLLTPDLTSVKYASDEAWSYTSAVVANIDKVVRVDGIQNLPEYWPDGETRNQIGLFTTTLVKNAGKYFVYEGFKLVPGEINLRKVHTYDNPDDPCVKALPKGKLTQHARSIGFCLASSFM